MISHRISQELVRVLWVIQKKRGKDQPSSLAHLVYYDAEKIGKSLYELIENEARWQHELRFAGERGMGEGQLKRVKNAIRLVAMRVYSDYDYRIIRRVKSDPYRLLRMAFAEPHVTNE